jgi:Protein of unknown function (DUF3617)
VEDRGKALFKMTRFAAACLALLAATQVASGAENLIDPGQWKVTSATVVNGVVQPPQPKLRCVTPEQAEDVARTFGPVSGTINSTCAGPEIQLAGQTLKWRLQCRGQLDADVAASFNFDSPQHYHATIISQGRMAGALISDVRSEVEGERVGDCPP